MQMGKLKIALLLLCCAVLAFEIWHLQRGSVSKDKGSPAAMQRHEPPFALLPESEIAAYGKSFANPKPPMQSWEPTVADINDLEASLAQITALSSKEQDTDEQIDHPDQYFRQYLAVVVNGKRTIFVNAFCSNEGHWNDWRKRLVIVMDGGKCFWNALYDPATQSFSDLKINGVA